MKKLHVLAITLALAALLCIGPVLAGCGDGNSGKAKDLAVKANEAATKMNEVTTSLTEKLQSLFGQISGGTIPDQAQYDAAVNEIKTLSDEVLKEVDAVRAEYEQMAKLTGVDKYAEFAKIQLEILDLTEKSIKAINAFLDNVGAMLAAGTLTAETFTQAQNEFLTQMGTTTSEAQKLSDQAKKLREDNNLF